MLCFLDSLDLAVSVVVFCSAQAVKRDQLPVPSLIHSLTRLVDLQENKEEKIQSLPVIMPGDKIPKFMAWPCPRQHSPPVADASAVATTTPEVAIPSQSLAAECSVN